MNEDNCKLQPGVLVWLTSEQHLAAQYGHDPLPRQGTGSLQRAMQSDDGASRATQVKGSARWPVATAARGSGSDDSRRQIVHLDAGGLRQGVHRDGRARAQTKHRYGLVEAATGHASAAQGHGPRMERSPGHEPGGMCHCIGQRCENSDRRWPQAMHRHDDGPGSDMFWHR